MKRCSRYRYHDLDLHPNLLAAMLIEQEVYPKEAISISTDDQAPGDQIREIVEVKATKDGEGLLLKTAGKSSTRKKLIEEAGKKSDFYTLMEGMEIALNHFRTELFVRERRQVLGTSDLLPSQYEFPSFLSVEYQKIMVYYLPWRDYIQGDLTLTAFCFESAIELPVKIEMARNKQETIPGTKVGQWVVDHRDQIGGRMQRTMPCADILVGPVGSEGLPKFVPGSPKYRFMEEVLFPAFLPEGWHWNTKILVPENIANFSPKNDNGLTLIGTNSWVY